MRIHLALPALLSISVNASVPGPCETPFTRVPLPNVTFEASLNGTPAAKTIAPAAQIELAAKFIEFTNDHVTFLENQTRRDEDPHLERFDELLLLAERGDGVRSAEILNTLFGKLQKKLADLAAAQAKNKDADPDRFAWEDVNNTYGKAPLLAKLARLGFAAIDVGHRAEGEKLLRYCVREFTTIHQPALHLPSASVLLLELTKRREDELVRELLPAIARAAAEAPHLVARAILQAMRYRHTVDAAGDREIEDFLESHRARFVGSDQILALLRKIHARGGMTLKKKERDWDKEKKVNWEDLDQDFVDVESQIIDHPWSAVSTTKRLAETGRELKIFDTERGSSLIQIARVLAKATLDMADRAPYASARRTEGYWRGELKFDPALGLAEFERQIILKSDRDYVHVAEERIRKYAYEEFVPDPDLREIAVGQLVRTHPTVTLMEAYPKAAAELSTAKVNREHLLTFSRQWQRAAELAARDVVDYRFGFEPVETAFMKNQLLRKGVNERAATTDFRETNLYNDHLLRNAKFLANHGGDDFDQRARALYSKINPDLGEGFNIHEYESRRGKYGSVLQASWYDGRIMHLRATVELIESRPASSPLADAMLPAALRATRRLPREELEKTVEYAEAHERMTIDLNLLRQLYRLGHVAEAEKFRLELLRYVATIENEVNAPNEKDLEFRRNEGQGTVFNWRRALEIDAPIWAIENLIHAGAAERARTAARAIIVDAERNLELGRDRYSGQRLMSFASLLGEHAATRALAADVFELTGRYLARQRGGDEWQHGLLWEAYRAVEASPLPAATRDRLIAGYVKTLWPEQMANDKNSRGLDSLVRLFEDILTRAELRRAQNAILSRLADAFREIKMDHDGMTTNSVFRMMTPMVRAVSKFNPSLLHAPDARAVRILEKTEAGRAALHRVFSAALGRTADLATVAERLRAGAYDFDLAHRQLIAYLESIKNEAAPNIGDAFRLADVLVQQFAFRLNAQTKGNYHAADNVMSMPLIADLVRLANEFKNEVIGQDLWLIILKDHGGGTLRALRALHDNVSLDPAASLTSREAAFAALHAEYGKEVIQFYHDRVVPLGPTAQSRYLEFDAVLLKSRHFSIATPRILAFISKYPERVPQLTARLRAANLREPLRLDLREPLDWLLAEMASKSNEYMSAFELYYFTRARVEFEGQLVSLVDAAGVERRARAQEPTFSLTQGERTRIDEHVRQKRETYDRKLDFKFQDKSLSAYQVNRLWELFGIATFPRQVAKFFDGEELTADEINRLYPALNEWLALRGEALSREDQLEMPGWMEIMPPRVRTAAIEFFKLLPYGERAELLAHERTSGTSPEDAPKAVRHFFEMTNLGKFGQFLSTQIDRVPAAYRAELVHFQENGEGSSIDEIRQTISSELGHPPEDLFVEIEPRAMNVGTVGEVFKATLKDGRPVVVKVLTPSRRRALHQMLKRAEKLTERLERKAAFNEPGWDVRPLFEAFSKNLRAEMDFTIELGHGQLLAAHLPVGATVPAYVPELTTESVLVQARATGVALEDIKDGDLRESLRARVRQIFVDQVQKTGVVHADLHPGNYRVPADGRGDIELLDAGRILELDETARRRHLSLAMAVQSGSVEGVITALGGDPRETSSQTPTALTEALGRSDLMARAMETAFVARQHGLEVPSHVIELLEASSKCYGE